MATFAASSIRISSASSAFKACSSRVPFSATQSSCSSTIRSRAGLLVQASNKDTPATPKAPASTASSQADRNIELLEERLRGGRVRKGKIEAKVKVTSPLVDAVSGRTPATPQTEAETTYITFLFGFFVLIITEGLTLAASGFMPEEIDAFVQDYLYPSYSPTVLAFLGASSLYGLWKTGKLPGMTQG